MSQFFVLLLEAITDRVGGIKFEWVGSRGVVCVSCLHESCVSPYAVVETVFYELMCRSYLMFSPRATFGFVRDNSRCLVHDGTFYCFEFPCGTHEARWGPQVRKITLTNLEEYLTSIWGHRKLCFMLHLLNSERSFQFKTYKVTTVNIYELRHNNEYWCTIQSTNIFIL